MTQKPFFPLSVLLAFALSACGSHLTNPDAVTITSEFFTATLPLTFTPEATQTPAPPTAVPTLSPIEGSTTTQVNVRAEPSTTGAVLGMILPSTKVQIIGKDASGTWYQLLYTASQPGKGWVLATYIQVAAGVDIPVIPSGAGSGSSASALIVQQVYVRSGPGTQFDALGVLSPNDVVALTGKDSGGAWLQIEYPGAPDSRGWINAQFAEAHSGETVPVVAESSTAMETETPVVNGLPDQAFSPAFDDGDSAESPSVTVAFSPTGTRAVQFSSDVSAPQGDGEDWVRFIPYSEHILIHSTCSGTGTLLIEVSMAGAVVENNLACGNTHTLAVHAAQEYLIHVAASPNQEALIHYTLKVEQLP